MKCGLHFVLAATSVFASACADRGQNGVGDEKSGLRMPLVFDLILHEGDTLYVGNLLNFEVFPKDGSFFLADGFEGRIARFDRTGKPIQVYGRKGSGPGELMSPGNPMLFWDSLLVTGDRGGILSFFRLDDGTFAGRPAPLPGSLSRGKVIGDRAWIGVHNYSDRTALAILSSPTAKPRYMFPLPREHLLSDQLQVWVITAVADLDSVVLVGISGNSKLWLTDETGRMLDSLRVPAVARRGVPDDVVERLGGVENDAEAFEAVSALYSLWALPGGDVGMVFYDTDVVDYERYILGAKIYVSVLSSDLTRACVDYLVAEATESRPQHAWRGDTLFIASQDVRDWGSRRGGGRPWLQWLGRSV